MANLTTTKSIDVGSMFLMDISVHESETNGDLLSNDSTLTLDESDSSLFTSSDLNLKPSNNHRHNQTYKLNENGSRLAYITDGHLSNKSIAFYQHQQRSGVYLGNSLDRLANAINESVGQCNKNGGIIKKTTTRRDYGKNTNNVTIVEPQPPPEIAEHRSPSSSLSTGSSSSLRDQSFIACSADSSIDSSFTISSFEAEDDKHGLKDLDGSLDHGVNDDEYKQDGIRQNTSDRRVQQEKQISNYITATNLINKSANNSNNNNLNNNNSSINNDNEPNNRPNKPTNNSNHHHSQRGQSKRSVSASLPIQVPARRMKKDLNKLKLGLKKNKNYDLETITTSETTATATTTTTPSTEADSQDVGDSKSPSYSNKAHQFDNQSVMSVAFDDVDEFLDQEYNDNHHNHYSRDEYDEENLRAEENPMKLFESIQQLARSLHEDTELFGSLPPKRMLESPIRSLAFT